MTANELFRLFNQMTYEEREQFIMVFTKYCQSSKPSSLLSRNALRETLDKEEYLND
jgi:hypothetical protein